MLMVHLHAVLAFEKRLLSCSSGRHDFLPHQKNPEKTHVAIRIFLRLGSRTFNCASEPEWDPMTMCGPTAVGNGICNK